MIQAEIQEVAGVFRGEWRRAFDPYPAYAPDLSWPSIGVLDALCGDLYGRSDWTDAEATFFEGAAAHFGELIYECWRRFAPGARVEYDDGVVCAALRDDGSEYRLELESELRRCLRGLRSDRVLDGRSPGGAAAYRHPMERFVLAACLGVGPAAAGRREAGPGGPVDHIEVVIAYLADTCADHYGRRFPREPLGRDRELYRRGLIRPPAASVQAIVEAASALLDHLDELRVGFPEAIRLLANLARHPSAAVREAALTCLALDERLSLPGELIEVGNDGFRHRSATCRNAAIELAGSRGRAIDWLNDGENAPARFGFERRIGLLPLVHLPFPFCADPANRELVEALITPDVGSAERRLEERMAQEGFAPELAFQLAILRLERGDPESAERLLGRIERTSADRLDGEFYLQAGLCAFELGELDEAIEKLERARALLQGDDRALTALGDVYVEADRLEQAVVLLNLAAARGERRASALVSRAELHAASGSEEGYHLDLIAAAWLHPFQPRVLEKVMAGYLAE